MIDTSARQQATRLLEAHVSGELTEARVLAEWPVSEDPALEAMRLAVTTIQHTGGPRTEKLARCIEFLKRADASGAPLPGPLTRWLMRRSKVAFSWLGRGLWGHAEWPLESTATLDDVRRLASEEALGAIRGQALIDRCLELSLSLAASPSGRDAPHLVWHYLHDADLRSRSPEYAQVQLRELSKILTSR